ncbi:MAG TPA: DUF1571 domain-containing protein [Thermoanaerobaculia bacterium]|nr:DUF1571 domain-containing protein [Thermoanaerobaculia bacterium]
MALAASLLVVVLAVPPVLDPGLSGAERRAAVAAAAPEELARAMREASPEELVATSLAIVERLGTYRVRMVKRERIGGRLRPAQEIDLFVRETPFAVRLHYVAGPARGRVVVYDPSVREEELRVHDGGLLSLLGSIWIGTGSRWARLDSNRSIRDAGLGNLLRRFLHDLEIAAPLGGFRVEHRGFDREGRYCLLWVAPAGGAGLESARTLVCADLAAGIPGRVEAYDASGALLESYLFSELESQPLPDAFFDPAALP